MVETLLTALIVLAATGYIARYAWRAFHGKPSGCGCDSPQCVKAASVSAPPKARS